MVGLCYPPWEGKGKEGKGREGEGRGRREGEGGKGKEGRGVPRSLGDVLDDKRGMREDNSGRRRRDVQNM